MGHVLTGTVSEEGEGAHLPRRKRRGSRTPRSRAAYRRRLGGIGEEVAARFLARKGCSILARNVRVGRGEIDLIIRDHGVVVAVEVKTGATPMDQFTDDKIAVVRAAMRRLQPPPRRLDLVTVTTPRGGRVTVRWYRGAG